MASPEMAGVLLPHSGSVHFQTIPLSSPQATGEVGLAGHAGAFGAAPLRPVASHGDAAANEWKNGKECDLADGLRSWQGLPHMLSQMLQDS